MVKGKRSASKCSAYSYEVLFETGNKNVITGCSKARLENLRRGDVEASAKPNSRIIHVSTVKKEIGGYRVVSKPPG